MVLSNFLNIDLVLVILFLAITLTIGLWSGKGLVSLQDYALGGRRFSTTALTATIIATWISGSAFSILTADAYQKGIFQIIARIGTVIGLLVNSCILAPRMGEFLGKFSIAEVAGDLYGKTFRIITAFCSIMVSAGFIAAQVKVLSFLFTHFFVVNSLYATLLSSIIVILYSTFGGVRAVIFTDIFQFLALGTFIPIIAIITWETIGSANVLSFTNVIRKEHFLDFASKENMVLMAVFLYGMIPTPNPAMFHRMLIARNTTQIQTSFLISAIVFFIFIVLAAFIGITLYSVSPDLSPNTLVMYIVDNYSYPGLKGFTLVGITAMVMSTADSHINTASVTFANDVCKPLGLSSEEKLLLISRFFAVFIGIYSLFMALSCDTLLQLVFLVQNFYVPIVSVPILMAILGFRSSVRAVFVGLIVGCATVVWWKIYLQDSSGVDSVIPATFANLFAFMLTHYILREPGGWVGPKDRIPLDKIRMNREYRKRQIFKYFELLKYKLRWEYVVHYCYNHSFNTEKYLYIFFSICMTLSLIIMLFVNGNRSFIPLHLQAIIFLITPSFTIMTAFAAYKMWPREFCRKYIGVIWHIFVFYTLILINTVLVFANEFAEVPLICFLLNLIIVIGVIRWHVASFMMITGIPLGILIFNIIY